MLGELVPVGGGDSIPLEKNKMVIGRRSSCDIVLDFANVSSQHAQLELTNGYWYLRDLNSRNGVKVNGERCDARWVQPGDCVSIARNDYILQYTAAGTAPPPEVEEVNPFKQSLLEKAGIIRRRTEETPGRSPSNEKPLRPSAYLNSRPDTPQQRKLARDEEEALRWLTEGEEE